MKFKSQNYTRDTIDAFAVELRYELSIALEIRFGVDGERVFEFRLENCVISSPTDGERANKVVVGEKTNEIAAFS